jgi:ferredoxin--NADP+ reductase
VIGSAAFVGWYNGHPEFADLDPPLDGAHAAVIGNGNVALDCARILAKTRAEFEGSDIVGHALDALDASPVRTITIVGRRGPHQIAMTPKELGELGRLDAASPLVDAADFPPLEADAALDPGQRKSVTILREFVGTSGDPSKPKRMVFDFFAKPLRIEGPSTSSGQAARAERLIVERTELDESGGARGTGETYAVPASLVITCIGYSTPPLEGVPYDERGGRFLNQQGRIADRLYCVGWARRGPTGTIGTNRPDGYEVAEQIAAAMPAESSEGRSGGHALKALLDERGVRSTDFADWRAIEKAEEGAARPGSPREKMVRVADWLAALGR